MERHMNRLCAVLIVALLAGCGGGGESTSSTKTITGVTAAGSPLVGTVMLKDSSINYKQLTATIAGNGSFSFDVSSLTPPFLIQAKGTVGGNNYTLYSLATTAGTCNINPLTTLAVTMANNGQDMAGIFGTPTPVQMESISHILPDAVSNIQDKFTPLFNKVGVSPLNIMTDEFTANGQGIDLLFDLISINVSNGSVNMVNKADGRMIFPSTSIASGVLSGGPDTGMMTTLFTVTGHVTYGLGVPATGIYVGAKSKTPTDTTVRTVQTDAQGNFKIFAPNDAYELLMCHSGIDVVCSIHNVVVSDANVSGLTFTAPPPTATATMCPPDAICPTKIPEVGNMPPVIEDVTTVGPMPPPPIVNFVTVNGL